MDRLPVPMSYLAGSGAFGARRGALRRHAGCDLYNNRVGTPIFPVAPGRVVRVSTHFLDKLGILNAGAIEVNHYYFTCRYCEISPAVRQGQEVRIDQPLGFIMNIKSGSYHPASNMLHFELYRGLGGGPLSVPVSKENPFGRRADLMNPTSFLRFLENFA